LNWGGSHRRRTRGSATAGSGWPVPAGVALDEQLAAVEPDTKEARQIVQTYSGCTELGDALYLPAVDQLGE
jgi:hypothetical protein